MTEISLIFLNDVIYPFDCLEEKGEKKKKPFTKIKHHFTVKIERDITTFMCNLLRHLNRKFLNVIRSLFSLQEDSELIYKVVGKW